MAADRHSPNAALLARAGELAVAAQRAAFPVRFAHMAVVFGRTKPDVDDLGYQAEDVLYEVLQDVGAVVEPPGWTVEVSQDSSADFYVVTFISE